MYLFLIRCAINFLIYLFQAMNNDVQRAFDNLRDTLENHQQDLEKLQIRRIENQSYRCAVQCTESSERSSQNVRQCVKTCFNKLTGVQQLFQAKQNEINKHIEGCMSNCEIKARAGLSSTEQPDDHSLEKSRQVFDACAISCPREAVPIIRQAFSSMNDEFSKL